MDFIEVENAIDNLINSTDKRTAAEIDAACCRTDRDYEHMRKMKVEEEEARQNLIDIIHKYARGTFN